MIKFCDSDVEECVVIDGIKFYFKQINVRTKLEIVTALSSISTKDNLIDILDKLKDLLSRVIVSVHIDNKAVSFADAFERFEDFYTIKKLMAEVIRYCTLTEVQRKNLDSSPEQPIPASAGSAEKPAEPDGEPVGTTPEQTEQ